MNRIFKNIYFSLKGFSLFFLSPCLSLFLALCVCLSLLCLPLSLNRVTCYPDFPWTPCVAKNLTANLPASNYLVLWLCTCATASRWPEAEDHN